MKKNNKDVIDIKGRRKVVDVIQKSDTNMW